jgi:streptogramin lyase
MGSPLAVVAVALVAAAAPPPPHVSGARDTTSTRPVFTFSAPKAVSYRCAFDSVFLQRCGRRYSQKLEPGAHVLRVRAVLRGGKLSRIAVVRVLVRLSVPELQLGPAISVGVGAGVPAVGGGAVWVPVSSDGTLVRVNPESGSVATRVPVGQASSAPGDLDSAVFAGGAVWAASDAGGTVARVDPATSAVTERFTTASRPGGLAEGGGFVWAFHFRQSTVTRIDAVTNAVRTFEVAELSGTGITYGDGSVWLLSDGPARVFRLDPATGAVQQTIPLRIPFPPRRAVVETWWLAYGDGTVWASLPNNAGAARIAAASGGVSYVGVPFGDPFGVAVGGGSVWVATNRAVWKLDEATGDPQAAAQIPPAAGFGFVSIAYGDGGAWLTTYNPGTLQRVSANPQKGSGARRDLQEPEL